MSASLTDTQISIFFKSFAIRKRLDALMLETTVWPMFTRRSMITPCTGDLMVQYSRLRLALSRDASALAICASACAMEESAAFKLAAAASYSAFAESYSDSAMTLSGRSRTERS